ncbi:MAG: hypothetical protein RL685_5707 [Pseudomonadota bacterium]|jgi:hypothetical protein
MLGAQRKKPAQGRLFVEESFSYLEREKRFELSTSTLAKPPDGVSRSAWVCQPAEITQPWRDPGDPAVTIRWCSEWCSGEWSTTT